MSDEKAPESKRLKLDNTPPKVPVTPDEVQKDETKVSKKDDEP